MGKYIGRGAVARKLQGRWPEQGMEIQNIFTDEMVLLGSRIRLDPLVKVQAFSLAVIEEAGVVTNRGIKPDIEVLTWRIRNLKTEIGGIAGDIPVA